MRASIITLVAATGASLVSAGPIKRQSCSLYPWFLAPSRYVTDCSAPSSWQPTSGPETSKPNNQACQPLYQPGTAPTGFLSVGVNPTACPDQTYSVYLYSTPDCSDHPVFVNYNTCVASANPAGFLMFTTVAH